MPSCYLNMFNIRFFNAATIRYSLSKFGHMHLFGIDCKYFSPHSCKCNSLGCIAAIRCGNACHGSHSDRIYSACSGSEHSQFDSPRLVKREAASLTHGGRWLAQTNYDTLMTHHTAKNWMNDCKSFLFYFQMNSDLVSIDEIYYTDVIWRLQRFKPPTTRLFVQHLAEADNKEHFRASHYWESIAEQRASNAGSVSMS